ncbi:MAG: hypothetical protein COA88_13560 [Kordia sp.]|nr:MAG: hypothetical protein COA88_13560 [Kordia sp.]
MKTSKADITLLATEKYEESDFPQQSGKIVAGFITIADASLLPKDIVTATIENQDGKPLYAYDVREWFRRSGGDFISSMIPLSIEDSARKIKLTISTKTAPTVNVVMQMVLIHEVCENRY